ncbi:hypothetical protein ACNOYE_13100 [Nannocystaceae bacterium ST9]
MRHATPALLSFALACSKPSEPTRDRAALEPEPEQSAAESERASDASPTRARPQLEPISDCAAANAEYAALRESLNTCRVDDDCAELWPGLCPHGPAYVNRLARIDRLFAREQAIFDRCSVPECAKPIELGPAQCVDGRCVADRQAPEPGCFDVRVDFLALDRPFDASLVGVGRVEGPRMGVGVPSSGVMTIAVDWGSCSDCTLEVMQLDPVAGLTLAGQPSAREGSVETLRFDVARSTYYLTARSQSLPALRPRVTLGLLDGAGEPLAANQYGIAWLRRCPSPAATVKP